MGAEVVLTNEASGLIHSEQLFNPRLKHASSQLEGLWWLPRRNSSLQLFLANRSGQQLSVSLSGAGEGSHRVFSRNLLLGPHETRRVWVDELAPRPGGLPLAGSISIRHDGRPTDLLARGWVEERELGFSSEVVFLDPATCKSNSWQGAGLRLGRFLGEEMEPLLLLKNVSAGESTVRVRLGLESGDGQLRQLLLNPIHLPAGRFRDLSVQLVEKLARSPELQDSRWAGLDITYDGAPGSVVAAAGSVNLSASHFFRLSLVDPESQMSPAGGFPWTLEQNWTTLLHFKNTTDRPQHFIFQIRYDGGMWNPGMQTLAPHESRVIDIGRLQQEQQQDESGRTLPGDVKQGQVLWSARYPMDPSTRQPQTLARIVIGRAQYVDRVHGFVHTYSCLNCCPDSFDAQFMNPADYFATILDSLLFSPFEQDRNCYGVLGDPYLIDPSIPDWASSNTAVATVDAVGNATAVGTGSASINAFWDAWTFDFIGIEANPPCQAFMVQVFGQAPFTSLRLEILDPLEGTGNLWISPGSATVAPSMPGAGVTARLVGWTSGIPGEVAALSWDAHITYQITFLDSDNNNKLISFLTSGDVTSTTDTVDWSVPLAGNYYGGAVTVTVDAVVSGIESSRSYHAEVFPYSIVGQQPLAGAVKGYIDTTMPGIWFAKRIAKHETDVNPTLGGYAQFLPTSGLPRYANNHDGGYGIFQLSPPSTPAQYWNWQANVDGGKKVLEQKRDSLSPRGATKFWNDQKDQFNTWNSNHSTEPILQVPPPDPTIDGDCVFSFSPSGSEHSYRDAIWIKMYNGASQNYISWDNVTDPNHPQWAFSKTNANGKNYVDRICTTVP